MTQQVDHRSDRELLLDAVVIAMKIVIPAIIVAIMVAVASFFIGFALLQKYEAVGVAAVTGLPAFAATIAFVAVAKFQYTRLR